MTDRRRVAVTLEQCWHRVPGGTAVATLEVVRTLAEAGEIDLVGVSARHQRPPPEAFLPPIDVAALPLPRLALYEAWHHLRWPAVETATGPVDVIHATAVAIPPATSPLVVTIHDLAFLSEPGHATRHGNRFFRRGTHLARKHADLVLCPSLATMEECRAAGFDPKRLRLVPWGVRSRRASRDEVDRVRRIHGLQRPYVLFAGTLEPRKNLGGLIEGFSAMTRRDVDLVIVGPDGWNEDLASRLAPLGERARPLGYVQRAELEVLYAGAAAFCYPSLREGFGLPVIEAMAQGTPVVTSAGTATEEVLGDAGLLVDPRDSTTITKALDRVLSDRELADDMAGRGRERAAEFTWQRTADLTAAAYEEAVRSRRAP